MKPAAAEPAPKAAAAAGAATLAAASAVGAAQALSLAGPQWGFTPFESLLGGLALGVVASSKFLVTGRILGGCLIALGWLGAGPVGRLVLPSGWDRCQRDCCSLPAPAARSLL